MRVYISSPGKHVMRELASRCPGIKLNILLSKARMPANYKAFLAEFEPIIESVILDNGAFSVMHSKLDITLSQLLTRFTVHSTLSGNRYLMVFSPDFNFGPQGFEENYERLLDMEELNIEAVPVIHNLKNHEIWSYAEDGHEFVAIGQYAGRKNPEVLFQAVNRLRVDFGMKVHLFGISDFSLISLCPAFSCDSKSWLNDALTGIVRFWNPAKTDRDKTDILYFPDELDKMKKGTISRYHYKDLDVFKKFIGDELKLTLDEFVSKKRGSVCRQLAAILYYNTLERVVTDIHLKEITII